MTSCPDCYSQIGSAIKHRPICLVRSNKRLKTWLESIEFWLRRIENHLSQSYKNLARYAYVGSREADRIQAAQEYESSAEMVNHLPKILAQLDGYCCERVNSAQLRSRILSHQLQETAMILRSL